jgi:hypothetical protein
MRLSEEMLYLLLEMLAFKANYRDAPEDVKKEIIDIQKYLKECYEQKITVAIEAISVLR